MGLNKAIEDERVQELLDDLDATLEQRLTLSPGWYADAEVFAAEQEVVFRRKWQYLGSSARVPNAGDRFTTMIGQVPVVVVRDRDGELRGYVNVCRHRGSRIVGGEDEASGSKSIQCSYHGWTWNLQGKLIGVPRSSGEQISKDDYPLVSIPLGTWGPLIFGNLDPGAQPFETQYSEMIEHVASMGHDLSALEWHPASAHTQAEVIETNWKLMTENNVECYHCATTHSWASEYYSMSPKEYRTVTTKDWAFQHLVRRETADIKDQALVPLFGSLEFYTIFPNMQIMFYPEAMSVATYAPQAPGKTEFRRDMFFMPGTTQEDIDKSATFYRRFWPEDLKAMEETYIGQASRAVRGGPVFLDSESLLRNIQESIRESFADEVQARSSVSTNNPDEQPPRATCASV